MQPGNLVKTALGRLVSLFLVTATLLAAFPPAAPPARAQEPSWTEVPLPATVGLGAVRALAQVDADAAFAVVSRPLGSSYLVKTTDGGSHWSAVGHISHTSALRPSGLAADLGEEGTVALLAVSPNFSKDSTLFLALTEYDGNDDELQTPGDNISQVFRSEDGGATFEQVGAKLPGFAVIKTLAIASQYTSGRDYSVLVGTADPSDDQRGALYRLVGSAAASRWSPWGPQGDYYAAIFFPASPQEVMVVAASDHGPDQDAIREYRIGDITKASSSVTLYHALIAGEVSSTAFEPAIGQAPVEADNSATIALPIGWTPQTALDRELITFSTGNGAGGLFRRSSPLSIAAITAGIPRGDYHSLALRGTPTSGVALIGGEQGELFRSTDGGLTWTPGTKGNEFGLDGDRGPVQVTLAGGRGFAATGGRGGGLFKTEDAGLTWVATILVTTDLTSNLVAMAAAGEDALLVIGRSRNNDNRALFHTTDGGTTWLQTARFSGIDTILVSPAYLQDSTVYLAAKRNLRGQVYRSTDGGKAFSSVADPGSGLSLASLAVLSGNVLVVSLADGRVVLSEDGGGSWKAATISPTAPLVSMKGDSAGQRLVGISAGREVFYSRDRGASWTSLGAVGFGGEGKDVAFHPQFLRNNMVLAALAGGGSASLFRGEVGSGVWLNASPAGMTGAQALAGTDNAIWAVGTPQFIYSAFGAVDGPLAWRVLPPVGSFTASGRALIALRSSDSGGTGAYLLDENSDGRSFILTFTDDVSRPVLLEPADRVSGVASRAVLVWAPVAGASEYEVQLGISRDLVGAQLKTTKVPGAETTLWYPQGMLDGIVYYWRVRVSRPLGGDWSRTFSFSIGTPKVDPSPTVAQALAPLGDAYTEVWGFDAATQKWQVYKPGAPDFVNTLGRLEPRQGYWVHMKREARLNYGAAVYFLQRGFNLIGWTGGQ